MQAETLSQYLDTYGATLVQQLDTVSKPLVKSGERKLFVDLLREPFPSQWERIEAIAAGWDAGRRYAVLSGATGIGKTIISMSAIHAHARGKSYRALIVCPSHLCKKWVREIENTIPSAKAYIIGKYSDLIKMKKLGAACGPEYYILSDSKSKLGTTWVPSYKKQFGVPDEEATIHCPSCNEMVMVRVSTAEESVEVPAGPKDIAKKQTKCTNCKEPLYQWTHKLDRWPCADYIRKRMRHWFTYFVLDEAHGARNATSAIGIAVGQIAACVKYSIAMTGTLINGYADSLFPTLYRFDSPKMVDLGLKWNDSIEFVRRYGRLETITVYEDKFGGNDNLMSKGKQKGKTVRVKPGIVPSLYGDCLMSNALFMSLEDLGFDLPVQNEFLHGVDMDPDMRAGYNDVEETLVNELAEMLRSGSKAAMSVLLNTLLGWPDYPTRYGEIGWTDAEGEWHHVMDSPELNPSVVRAKEEKLIEIVTDAVDRDRQAWVFCTMTQKRDVQTRLQSLLTKSGLDCRVLRSQNVPTDKREEWIEKNGKANVIISHPAVVQTGLDFFLHGSYNFCSLVWYSMGYQLDVVRQASGRARRVGQTKTCELNYLYYRESMQERAALLMSDKTKAAQSIDGNFSAGGLAGLSGDDDNAAMVLVRNLLQSNALRT